jgi:hypothetical protein
MIIDLNNEIPSIHLNEDLRAVIVRYTRREAPEDFVAKLGVMEVKKIWNTEAYQVTARPEILDEAGRIDRWLFTRLFPRGYSSNELFEDVIQIDIHHPLRSPRIVITRDQQELVQISLTDPIDLWDGQKILEPKTDVYDRLRDGVDLLEDKA